MSARSANPLGVVLERVGTAAALGALALFTWQAGDSVRDVVSELSGKPLDRHLLFLRASPDELVRLKLGADHEVLEAMRAHLPRDARVFVSFPNVRSGFKELRRRITWLGSLAYPIVLEGWPYEAGGANPPPAEPGRREFVLDLESGRDFSAWPLCEELARGARFRLLLVGSAPP